ncbi:uncharacterized protein TNCV_2704981 [Trichonephila clavipes]|nr:uncharacterized protein TNCV_2704981 [Trichonephila clavipes]
MNEDSITKKVFNAQPMGTRRKGRPNFKRIDGLEKDLLVLRTGNWRTLAGRRLAWKRLLEKISISISSLPPPLWYPPTQLLFSEEVPFRTHAKYRLTVKGERKHNKNLLVGGGGERNNGLATALAGTSVPSVTGK